MKIEGALKILLVFITGSIFLFSSCSKGNNPGGSGPVPNVTVNVSININNSPYTGLGTIGGVIYLANVGNRGILLYRLNSSTIMAFDRTCTYNISNTAAYVQAQNNGTAICLDCSSTYSMASGGVNSGPSTIGLKVYNTTFNSTTGALTITN